MARFDGNTGMWAATAPDGTRLGLFRTQAEAVAAEQANAPKINTAVNDQEFGRITGGSIKAGTGASGGAMGFDSNTTRRTMLGADVFAKDEAANLSARNLRAEQDRLASVPYGTPASQGGTASQFVATQGTGTGGTTGQVTQADFTTGNRYATNPDGTFLLDANGNRILLGPDGLPITNGVSPLGTGSPGGGANGDIDYSLSEATETVAGDNDTQGIIDRVDQIIAGGTLERDAGSKAQIDQALAAQQGVIDRVLSQESDARIIAEQMAAEQRGQALSARGGAAAQQQAMSAAAAQAPALQTAASRAAAQETTQRNALAGQVAGQMGQVALGSEQNDIRIQEANAGMADSFAKMVSTLGGVELQMNQQDRHKMGQMVFDFQMLTQNTDLGWAKLGNDEKMAILDYMLGRYQIDETTAANIKMTAMNNEEDFIDQLVKLGGIL